MPAQSRDATAAPSSQIPVASPRDRRSTRTRHTSCDPTLPRRPKGLSNTTAAQPSRTNTPVEALGGRTDRPAPVDGDRQCVVPVARVDGRRTRANTCWMEAEPTLTDEGRDVVKPLGADILSPNVDDPHPTSMFVMLIAYVRVSLGSPKIPWRPRRTCSRWMLAELQPCTHLHSCLLPPPARKPRQQALPTPLRQRLPHGVSSLSRAIRSSPESEPPIPTFRYRRAAQRNLSDGARTSALRSQGAVRQTRRSGMWRFGPACG